MDHAAANKGKRFEETIADLYRLLGFEVSENTALSSRQTDLLCVKTVPGGATAKICVECKYRDHHSVSNREVSDFISAYDTLRIQHHLSGGVLVSNLGGAACS